MAVVQALRDIRSWLFVPALQSRYIARALESEADAFIVDLEDSIPPGQKAEARAALAEMVAALRGSGRPVFVRVNLGVEADLVACAVARPDGVVLPKVEVVAQVMAAETALDAAGGRVGLGFMLAVESGAGVLNAATLFQASTGVSCVMFGAGDFVADTGFAMDADALTTPAAMIAMAAAAAGVPAFGVPGSIGEMNDLEALGQCARRAKALGYAGTPVIHPKQLDVVNTSFQPDPEDIAEARLIVATYEASSGGASAVGGRFVERPLYLRSQAILRRSGTAQY